MYVATRDALSKARKGEAPTLIEAFTYRLGAHTTSDDPTKYRKKEEVEEWEKKDPIKRFRIYLEKRGIWNKEYENEITNEISHEIEKAVEEAEAFKPNMENMFRYVYAEMPQNLKEQMQEFLAFMKKRGKTMKLNMVQTINLALHEEMERDSSVLVMGEDVGVNGGVFRATHGLIEKFGSDRVIDTPLAESGIIGTAIGMAVFGLKPIAEIHFLAFNQMVAHASRIRYRSRGAYHCSMVIRSPYGGGVKALEHHSEAVASFYIHMPGMKVVIPSSPYDAKGLLLSSIRDPDPVFFFEHKKLYRAFKEEVPDGEYTIPLGEGKKLTQGKDITVISWGAMVHVCKKAIEKVDAEVELIDLRTLSPLDENIIIDSVKKTGRVVIVHEEPKTLGFGAEIIARINEKALLHLEAPVKRVTGYDVPVPLLKLEEYYLPDAERVAYAIEEVVGF